MHTTESFLQNCHLGGDPLTIYTYPHSILKKKAKPVTLFNDDLRALCRNMFFTMYQAPGVGLAAPQVGQSIRLLILDVDYKREKILTADGREDYELSNFNPQVLINPRITKKEGEITHEEGCLSVPGYYEDVKRAEKITVEYQDMWGNPEVLEANNLLSVCVQHENDHLDGIIFLERLGLLKKKMLIKKYLKEREKKLSTETA